MSTVSLVWRDGDRLRVSALAPDTLTTIGRQPDCTVVIDDPAVSRLQAEVGGDGGRFWLENRSQSNATTLDGVPVGERVELLDGGRIGVGTRFLVFHNLRAGDRIAGPTCSHCGRANEDTARHCWYCGTSLVNALSTERSRRRVAFRSIDGEDRPQDVLTDEALVLGQDGDVAARMSGQTDEHLVTVNVAEDGAVLHLPPEMSDHVIRNGEKAGAGAVLADGDEIEWNGGRIVVLLRTPART